jgi:hypothetical protein
LPSAGGGPEMQRRVGLNRTRSWRPRIVPASCIVVYGIYLDELIRVLAAKGECAAWRGQSRLSSQFQEGLSVSSWSGYGFFRNSFGTF